MGGMSQTPRIRDEPDNGPAIRLFTIAHRMLFGLCVVLAGMMVAEVTSVAVRPEVSGRLAAALALAATLSTLMSLSRQLPVQNVLLAAAIIGAVGGFAGAIGRRYPLPLCPIEHLAAASPRLGDTLSWWMPPVWIIFLLNSRGAARLILRPRRKTDNYGFLLIGLTVALSFVFELGLGLFLAAINGPQTRNPVGSQAFDWSGAPLRFYAGWTATVCLALFCATPVLINKKPVEFPPDYQPLILWTLLNLVFVCGAVAGRFGPEAAPLSAAIAATLLLAWRSARR